MSRLLLLLAFPAALLQDGAATRPFPEFAPKRLREDLAVLASDEMEGREAGEPGEARAAEFVRARFEELGLQPVAGSYVHPFPVETRRLDPERTFLVVDGERIEAGNDFLPHPAGPEGRGAGPIVFAGYGITSFEHEYDDFDGVDLEGKVALLLRWEPQAADRDSPLAGRRFLAEAKLGRKVRECERRGAVAVLIANPPGLVERRQAPGSLYWPEHSPFYSRLQPMIEAQVDPKELRSTNRTVAEQAEQTIMQLQLHFQLACRIPVAFVSQDVLEQIFEYAGSDPRAWRTEVDASLSGFSFELSQKAELSVGCVEAEKTGSNVLGMIPGSDPELRDEIVVIGAHLDHVGRSESEIWNGADDNGSGTVTLMALAASFASGEVRTKRTLVFAAFSAEEMGLLGAAWLFVQNLVPPDRIAAMLNLDMVGRSVGHTVYSVGVESAPGLRGIVERAAEGLELNVDFDNNEFLHRSDQLVFYKHEIPVVFFNTDQHPDYHKPTDTFEKIDYETMAAIGALARRVTHALADLPHRLEFRESYGLVHPAFGQSPDTKLVHWIVPFEQRTDY